MRAVPLALVLLLVAVVGVGGWFLGRASVDPVVQVVETAARPEPAPIPRPSLEVGRGGTERRRGPEAAPEPRPPEPVPGADGPKPTAEDTPLLPRPTGLEGALRFRPVVQQGLAPFTSGRRIGPDEPESVAEAARTMLANPEEATRKIESLLDSRDASERAGAYRLLGEARHASHRPLVERAQREAKTDDEIRSLLAALARFKGPTWSAVQITGPPDTPLAGDLVTAWASKGPEMGEVWIDLEYPEAVSPEAVRVHETYNPGAVARVLGQRTDGTWVTLWEGTATPQPAPTWFEPRLESVRLSTAKIRLIVDTNRVEGWNEIDAVELVGDGKRQWAFKAQAGSNYAE